MYRITFMVEAQPVEMNTSIGTVNALRIMGFPIPLETIKGIGSLGYGETYRHEAYAVTRFKPDPGYRYTGRKQKGAK